MDNSNQKLALLKTVVLSATASLVLMGCESTSPNTAHEAQPQQSVNLKTPTKEILTFEGDCSRSYVVLGNVEYKLDKGISYGSTLDVPMEAQKLLKEGLKSVAFTKYGEKVDALINVKMGKAISGGFFGTMAAGYGAKNTMVSGEGVAVSYSPAKDNK